jgi:hypothetical protein
MAISNDRPAASPVQASSDCWPQSVTVVAVRYLRSRLRVTPAPESGANACFRGSVGHDILAVKTASRPRCVGRVSCGGILGPLSKIPVEVGRLLGAESVIESGLDDVVVTEGHVLLPNGRVTLRERETGA